MRRLAPVLILSFALGCGGGRNISKPSPIQPDAFGVTCNDPFAKGDAWLSDGVLGVRVGRDGAGSGPSYAVKTYESGGEERLQPLPNPILMTMTLNGKQFAPQAGRFYEQRFDFATRRLSTRYFCEQGQVETTSWVQAGIARQTWRINVEEPGHFVVMLPEGARTVIKKDGELRGPEFEATKGTYVDLALNSLGAADPQIDQGTIEIDGPVDDQQAVNSFLAYLRMAIPNQGQQVPVSPTGLSADFYRGHVFWDADVWVFPALALLDPDRAKVISSYRIAMLEGAKRNYKTWIKERAQMLAAGKPKASQPPNEGVRTKPEGARYLEGAAKYPWESSVSGTETMIGQFRQALHQNGAVLWGLNQAQWLGLADPAEVKKVQRAMALLWASVYEPRQDGTYGIRQVLGVDEFKLTDNDLITNLLARWTKDQMQYTDPEIAEGLMLDLFLPQKNGIFQTYEGDKQLSFKQASAVLSIFPYQYPPAERVAAEMMNYYAPKTSPLGPAMTEAIHATIYARTNQPDKAYSEWRKAWEDFTKDRPLLLFSEHRKRDRTYFVTGAAGCLQSVLYGFLGFRIDYSPEPGAKWSKQLRGGGWLSINPHLPKEWKRVVVRNFSVLGHRYTATITSDSVKVTQGDP